MFALYTTQLAQEWLEQGGKTAVLSVFPSVCNLVNGHGQVLTLSMPPAKGPFSLGLPDHCPPFHEWIDPQTAVAITANGSLQIGDCLIQSQGARVWPATPPWQTISATQRAFFLSEFTHINVPSLTELFTITNMPSHFDIEGVVGQLLTAVTNNDRPLLTEKVTQLAGLGPGLTPAGDDFLMGTMYGMWATFPDSVAKQMCEQIMKTAVPRTTTLSAMWLRAAVQGQASQPWHSLIYALNQEDPAGLQQAMQNIIDQGHTSGATALWGFKMLL